jgi:hypothetical protein
MAFITNNSGTVISFAEYEDVQKIDQRVFESNEGLTEVIVEDMLVRSTERLISLFSTSDWWRSYYIRQSGASVDPLIYTNGLIAVPSVDPNKIKARKPDFTDLCVFYTLTYYLLPKIADFSKEDNSERVKIGFFNEKYRVLYQELIDDGSWYDFSGDGSIASSEKMPVRSNIVRVR